MKLKLKKYPKAPKSSASIQAKENYIKRIGEVKKENQHVESLNRKSDELTKKIRNIKK